MLIIKKERKVCTFIAVVAVVVAGRLYPKIQVCNLIDSLMLQEWLWWRWCVCSSERHGSDGIFEKKRMERQKRRG
jgi:hypothetical protein